MNPPPRKSRRIAWNAEIKEAQRKQEEKRQLEHKVMKMLQMQKTTKQQQEKAEDVSEQQMTHAAVKSSKEEIDTDQIYQQRILFHRPEIRQQVLVTSGMIHEAISSTLDFTNFDFSNKAKKSVPELVGDMAAKIRRKNGAIGIVNGNNLSRNVMLRVAEVSKEEEMKQKVNQSEAKFNLALQNWALHYNQ